MVTTSPLPALPWNYLPYKMWSFHAELSLGEI